jgi:hypothetical protein
MGRALIADPMLPEKARAGNLNAIRPCIGCCLGCIHAVLALEPGSCVVNPDVGREYLMDAKKKKRRLRRRCWWSVPALPVWPLPEWRPCAVTG